MMDSIPASSAGKALKGLEHLRVRLFLSSLLVGALCGVVISLYRVGIRVVSGFMLTLVKRGHADLSSALLTLLVFAAMGVLSALILRAEPNISGSGIPQISAELSGRLNQRWQRVLPLKFLGGLLSLGGGLTLGREGPSVQVGGSVGAAVAQLLRRPQSEKDFLVTGGAAAGLAAAFNAPVSGVVFALEELHRHFSPRVLLSAMTAAFVSDFVSANIFGFQPVLAFHQVLPVPLQQYGVLLMMGVLAGLSGIVFNRGILLSKSLYARIRRCSWLLRGLIPFVLTGIVLLIVPDLFGSGEELIFLPAHGNLPPAQLLGYYAIKLLLLWIAFGSGIAGGIFFPLLVLGSLLGNMSAQVLHAMGLIGPDMVLTISLLAMAAHFAAIVRSPLTGILLIAEMTGSFAFMLPLGIVCLTAYMTAEALRCTPIYESLVALLPNLQATDYQEKEGRSGRLIKEYVVAEGSSAAKRQIREIAWPRGLLIVTILRGAHELLPLADQQLMPGDFLLLLGSPEDFVTHHDALSHLLETA